MLCLPSAFRYHRGMKNSGKLVLIIGPSGVGKSVILHWLKTHHSQLVFPKSATTRSRRPREGDDLYHFVTEDEFKIWLAQGKFLESAHVHKGAWYGTLLQEIIPAIERGDIVVREVDVQGFHSIRKHPQFSGPNPAHRLQTIFILPESEQQLIHHIRSRAPISDDELQRRIASMREELACATLTDAQIRNTEGDLQNTIKQVEELVLKG